MDNKTVRAKFKVESVTSTEGDNTSVKLKPVVSGSKENEEFFKWTPGGVIELNVVGPQAAEAFKPGRHFYVDFTETT